MNQIKISCKKLTDINVFSSANKRTPPLFNQIVPFLLTYIIISPDTNM